MAHDKQKLEHNILALDGVTDLEYVEEFGVPNNIANTPAINEWLINDTYEKNLEAEYTKAVQLGRNESEAQSYSKQMANKGRQEARKLLKEVRDKRGY